jgi:hypothetical protein
MEDNTMSESAWEVIYNDKTSFRQFNDNGTENSFGNIRQDDVFEFRLYHNRKTISLLWIVG